MHRYLNLEIGPPSASLGLVLVSMAVGVGITLLAGLIPAVSATRISPLEALRPPVGVVSFKRLTGAGFWSGIVMIALAAAALFTQNVSLIGLGGVLFVLGLILAAPALVNPIANLLGSLLSLVYARSGTAELAQGNLSRQPGRAAITASTTLIAMAILIMAAAMFTSVKIGFGQVMRQSLGSDYILVPPSIAAWGTNVGAGAELADEMRSVEGVEVVSTLRFSPSEVKNVAIAVLGIDPADYPQVSGLTFSSGEPSEAYAALGEGRSVIINPVLAATAGVQSGDEIELLTPTGLQTYRVAAVAGDYLNAKIATAYLSQADMAADFNRTEDVLIQANLSAQADPQAVESAFKALVKAYPQFRLINGKEYIEENLAIFDTAFLGIYILVIFLAIPSLIAMVNTLAIGVIERTREIGMLRAVGATRKQVRTMVVAEALILAAIGTGFGVLSGLYLGYMAVEAVGAAGFPMRFAFPAGWVLIALAAGIFFGVLAAIIPARQAARLDIVTALHYE
jgi:putative ABC transport system permease protein